MKAKVRVPEFLRKKQNGEKIVALTAYDYTMASIVDRAGVDMILVGDSLGTVVQGQETTLKVSLDQMVYHTQMVSRATQNAFVVADMPFLTYQVSPEEALINAGSLIQEGGAEAVKVEGGFHVVDAVTKLVESGIPVMGHLGLTPQSFHAMGGYRVKGRNNKEASEIEASALALEEAGAFAIVLEGIPSELAAKITKLLSIPTIGIGAGLDCDGQVLVINDLLGLSSDLKPQFPKFVKNYLNLSSDIAEAIGKYVEDVRAEIFPEEIHTYSSAKPRLVKNDTDKN